jgi:hypothetical protein
MLVKKVSGIVALTVTSIFALSGCLRLEADLYVNSDATAEKAVILVAVNKSATSSPEVPTSMEDFKKGVAAQLGIPNVEKSCEYTETTEELIAQCETSAQALYQSELSSGTEQKITLSGDVLILTLAADPGQAQATENAGETAPVSLKYRFHFPGEVATVSGAGVSVDPQDLRVAVVDEMERMGAEVVVTASASPQEQDLPDTVLFLAGALVLLLIISSGFISPTSRKS